MAEFYTGAQKGLQAHFQAEKLAEAMTKGVVHSEILERERAFIEARDMFFLASVDSKGRPTCSYKGGDPGFVRVLDPQTLVFPIYDGNGMFLSAGNIQECAKVGLLFIDFETPHRLRVQGSAAIQLNDELLSTFHGADLVVRVQVESVFVNCPRYVHKRKRVEPSRYVPRANEPTPYPQWKRIDAFQSALAPRDIGKTEESGGAITIDEYRAKLLDGNA